MDYWQEFQQKWLGYVPLFLLTLGCGIESGALMTLSFLCQCLICKKKGISLWGGLVEAAFSPSNNPHRYFFICLCSCDPSVQ